jgi:hypothetical protein
MGLDRYVFLERFVDVFPVKHKGYRHFSKNAREYQRTL